MMSVLTAQIKPVIVTGAFRGIGNIIFRHLNPYYPVWPVCHSEEQLQCLLQSDISTWEGVTGFHGDLRDPSVVHRIAEHCRNSKIRPHGLIHCPGPIIYSQEVIPVWSVWESLYRDNVAAAVHLIREISGSMQNGRIVLFGFSGLSIRGYHTIAAYAAAKDALASLARSAAKSLARKGTTVNVVAPGVFMTENGLLPDSGAQMLSAIPMQRAGTPEDITGVIDWLLSARSDYVTGQVLKVSGGLHIS